MGLEDRFFRSIVDALTHDRLTLPTLPEIAVRISHLTQQEDVTAARLAQEIGKDPAMAVRLLRVANSASQSGGGRRIENVQQAIARLGLELTRLLVSGLAIEQMFTAKSLLLKERLRRSWARSVEVAALAQVLAAHCTLLKPELALLAGLVHEVGVLPLIKFAETDPQLADSPPLLEGLIERLHPRVGKLVLQAWNFPEELVDVPQACRDFARHHDGPADHADVVMVAILQSQAGRDRSLARVDRGAVPAFAKLDLNPALDVFDLEGVQDEYDGQVARLAA